MNVQPASFLILGLALILPLWFIPASFEAFLLPKTVFLATGGLAALALRLAWPRGGRRWGALSWAWAGLLGALTLSYAASPWRAAGFEAYALASGFALAGLAASLVLGADSADAAAQSASLAAVAASAWALWQGLGAPSTFGNPNFLASYLVGCGPLMFALCARSKGPRAWFWAAAGGLCFAALIASGSRGAWLAAALIWPPAFALTWRAACERSPLNALAAVCASVLIWNLASTSPASVYVQRRAASALSTDTAAFVGRKLMWRAARDMTYERPLLGQGPGGYHYRYLEFQARALARPEAAPLKKYWTYTHSAHDAYFQLAADSGLLGIFALLILLWFSAKGWWSARSALEPQARLLQDAWAAAALALLVDGFLGMTLQLPASAFLLALALNASAAPPASAAAPAPPARAWRWALAALVMVAALPLGRLQASDIMVARAMAAVQTKNLERAKESLRKAAAIAPMHARAHFFQGNALLLLGEAGAAVPPLLEALRRSSDPNIPYNLGLASLEQGNSTAAKRWCAESLRLKPDFPEVFATLGFISRREGRNKEAETWLWRALHAAPGNPAIERELGLLYRQSGNKRRARRLLGPLARVYPDDEEVAQALRELAVK